MSWDIFIQRYPEGAATVAEIPDEFEPPPLGARDELIEQIRTVLPAADFSDPAWGVLRGDGWTIDFGLGDDPLLHGITLHVRGADGVLAPIGELLGALDLRAIDSWTGEFFRPDIAAHSLARWRSYVEQEI